MKDPEHPSVRRRSRERAFTFPHIEANPLVMRAFVLVDHDGGEAEHIASLAGMPEPSRISLNPFTGSGQIEYMLRDPVCLTDAARRPPVNLLARIEHGMVIKLGGDLAYGGRIMKNPLHDSHITLWGPQTALYGLRDLAHAEHRAAIAEAIATEREHTATAERRRADTLDHALRLLEPPRTPDPQPAEPAPAASRPRRPWWPHRRN